MKKGKDGKFVRIRKIWDGTRWNDGYKNNKGRFLVWRPDFPGHYHEGYALRYHVVWWLKTGQVIKKGYNLHHLNHKKTDDRFENLELIKHGEHSRLHNITKNPTICDVCAKFFFRQNNRKRYKNNFCSQECYRKFPKSPSIYIKRQKKWKRKYLLLGKALSGQIS